jgi:hypothetical protein
MSNDHPFVMGFVWGALVVLWFPIFRGLRKVTRERGVHPFHVLLRKDNKTMADKALLIGIARASVHHPYSSLTPKEVYERLAREWDEIPRAGAPIAAFSCIHISCPTITDCLAAGKCAALK